MLKADNGSFNGNIVHYVYVTWHVKSMYLIFEDLIRIY